MKLIPIVAGIVIAGASSLPERAEASQAEDISTYAACVLKRGSDEAKALLAAPVESVEERRMASLIVNRFSRCLDDTEIASPGYSLLRGSLAEALIAGDPALAHAAAKLEPATAIPAAGADRALMAGLGACLAAANPKAAAAVLATRRGSYAEREALNGFGSVLTGCVQQDSTYRMSIPDARNAVADALYQRVAGNKAG